MKYKPRPKPFERSGYFPTRDMMEHYRVPPQKESEYHRKLRQSIERDELSGPDVFRDSNPNYRIQEVKEDSDLGKFRESIIHDAIEQFKEQHNVDEIPEDKYEIAQDTAQELTEKLEDIHSDSNYNPTVVEFTENFLDKEPREEQSDLSLMNEARQVIIDEKMKEVDNFETLEQVEDKMSEIRGINDTLFDYMDSYDMQQKRGKFYSDSEVSY